MYMTLNSLGRNVPLELPGVGSFAPYESPFAMLGQPGAFVGAQMQLRRPAPARSKVVENIEKAVELSGLKDGMTISFHHHLRNGDAVIPMVLDVLRKMGFKGLTLAPSSIPDAHDCIADYIRSGLINRLYTSGVRGELGKLLSGGELEIPVVIRSHGGRARAIEEGSISIDVAFLAAPACDPLGNITGSTGPSACGSLGYAITDARYARHVVAITDNLVEYPLNPRISIPQYLVDSIVCVDSLGDPKKIATGAARITRNPVDLKIAKDSFRLMKASGILEPGFSFQMGVGGASLAVAKYLGEYMKEKGLCGSFGLGGVGGYMAGMLEEGLFDAVFDVQSFDSAVTNSMQKNPKHIEIDASWYASPFNAGCIVNNLDCVILAALEVDTDFNVNVLTGHDGVLRGASGGHQDTAAGAKLSIVVAPSFRGGVPSIKNKVTTVTTPGETVDAIVTERGICINPRREDLLGSALKSGLPVVDITELKKEVEKLTGVPRPAEFDHDKIAAVVEYRDGTLIDTVYCRK
ncbi:MAG: citrate lyase subunit alpha [Synergistaceae bacterium]|nr:citrate lyase subunit alpha [Synergistaceae bacterium]MDD4751007.1 citrate lyase subunit alpha [Synergistaceae bacterium]PKL05142.1 MAG: citrate lyase subunit alpha [Synergistetes bacterium HGW-Synergistetes-1]